MRRDVAGAPTSLPRGMPRAEPKPNRSGTESPSGARTWLVRVPAARRGRASVSRSTRMAGASHARRSVAAHTLSAATLTPAPSTQTPVQPARAYIIVAAIAPSPLPAE